MKRIFFRNCCFSLFFLAVITSLGCGDYADHGGITKIAKEATAPFNDEKKVDIVAPVYGKTVQVKTRYQGGLFRADARKDKIERFKCSKCHNNKEVLVENASEIAHGDIVLNHGEKDKPLKCYTCHKQDDRDHLVTEKGVNIDMDHSYQMCGQCHFRQKKDWVGGAHGKRISFWAGERIVMNCATCHNPHSPKFAKRWPQTYSLPLEK
jgi:formate-dependent nitrite reductase cytochrome c552 subunit